MNTQKAWLVSALAIVLIGSFGCHLRSEYVDEDPTASGESAKSVSAPQSTAPQSDYYNTAS